jgi:hypothetical protein
MGQSRAPRPGQEKNAQYPGRNTQYSGEKICNIQRSIFNTQVEKQMPF